MQYEFLKNFPKRMKNVGLYGVLIQNSIQKTSWKQFGFLKFDEQMNLIFAVMLYIMKQSLREENCTMDDIEVQREYPITWKEVSRNSGGESIYNRFDNIYVLNLIAASLRGGTQYLKAEHIRGKEPDELVTARIEVGDQMELLF